MLFSTRQRFVIGAALVLYALLVARFWFVCDDAYIAFTYARNLADGHGLVWYPGNAPVEGFSDPLWVVVMAACRRLGLEPVAVAPWISACSGLLLLLWVARLLARRDRKVAAVVAVVLLATMPPIALWSTGGLETMPTALLTFGVFALLLGQPTRRKAAFSAIAAASLVLLRPEGLPVVLLWVALGAWRWLRLGRPRDLGRALLWTASAAVFAAFAWLCFRVGYFGDLVPNTAHAKGGFHGHRLPRGLAYLSAFVLTFPGLAAVAGIAVMAFRDGRTRDLSTAAAVLTFAIAIYVVLIGGDFMPMGRFLVPMLPFAAVVFGLSIQRLWQHDGASRVVAATLVAAAAAVDLLPAFDCHVVPAELRQACHFRGKLPVTDTELDVWRQHRDGALRDERLAAELDAVTQPGQKLIREAIGVVAYRTHLEVLDSFGLVQRRPEQEHVIVAESSPGHDRYLPWTEFLDDRPDYIHAHIAPVGSPVSYSMLPLSFAMSPLADMVDVVRSKVASRPGEPELELRLLRFHRWDAATDAMNALLDAARDVDPRSPDAAAQLAAALPAGTRRELDRSLRQLLAEGRIAHHRCGPLGYSHSADPTPRSREFSVEVTLQDGPALPHDLPLGKFVYALPLAGSPELDGAGAGWLAVPPTTGRVDRVRGGRMLLVHLVPDGRIAFAPELQQLIASGSVVAAAPPARPGGSAGWQPSEPVATASGVAAKGDVAHVATDAVAAGPQPKN